MNGPVLPEGYSQILETGRSAEEVLAASAQGLKDIYFTAPYKSETDICRVIGKCRIVADSVEELRRIDHAVQDRAGTLEPVGIRLALDGWEGPGIPIDALPELSREMRKLPALSVQGCFVQGDTAGLYGAALGRYYRNCYEAAKRMSAVLPCKITFLCITGGGTAAQKNAREQPETLPEFFRTTEIVAAQNRSAFYARLLIT